MPTIKLKRSATQNAVPSTSQLGLGEVALNTYDGKMFIKKSVGGTESIVEIGGDATSSSGLDFTGNLNLADNVRIVIGDGNDLQIWHGGVDSYVRNYTGNLQFIQGADDKDIQFYCDDGSGGHVEYLRMDGSEGTIVASKNLHFNDNVKARFGNSADLQIVHDGSNSYIDDGGTGSLLIRGSEVVLGNGGKKGVRVIADGAVQIRHNDSTKIETTSAGATVTGTMLADAAKLTGSGFTTLTINSTRSSGNIGGMNFTASDTLKGQIFGSVEGELKFAVNGSTEAMRIDASGRLLVNTTSSIDNLAKIQVVGDSSSLARITLQDVDGTNQKTFFEQSGGGTRISTQDGTSNGFFTIGAWNGTASSDFVRVTSAGRVGIGTTAPEHPLHVSFSGDNGAQIKSTDNHASLYINAASGYGSYIRFEENNAQNYWINAATDGSLRFRPAGGSSNWVVFGSTGQVGIGTATPSRQLHILKSGTTSAIMIEAGDGSQSSVDLKNTEGQFRLINDGGAFSIYDQSDSAERFRIDTSGNVGIGITNPSTPLAVQSNSSAQGITILGRSTDDISQLDFVENDGTSIAGFQARTTDFRIRSVQNLPLLFMTNNTERVRIHNNGQLGIGVTNFTSALRGNGKQLIIGSCFVGTGAALVADDFARFGGALYIHEDAGTNSANVTSLDNNGDRLVITGKQGTTANALDAPDGFYVGGTQFITSSRQITNVTSITATGAISTTGNATIGGETKTDSLLVENPSTIGHTAIGSISNDGGSGYIRSSIVMTRDEDQITYNGSTDTWTHAGGSSTDWSMITHSANAGFQVYSGAAVSSSTNYTHSQFNDAYRHFQITAAGKALFYGNVQIDGTLQGPATFTIDPASYGDNTGTVVIAGNLQVDGTTTTINSTTLTVDDKNITLASGSSNAAAANGAGLTVDCGSDTDATLTYVSSTDNWKFDKPTRVSGLTNAGIGFTSTETLVDGSSALPNGRIFYHSSHLIYDSPSSGHRFAVAGNQGTNIAMVIDSGQRVGIGTTAPTSAYKLDVRGRVRIENDVPELSLKDTDGTNQIASIRVIQGNGLVLSSQDNTSNGIIRFLGNDGTTETERMRIDADGDVGIGTTSPDTPLHVFSSGTTQAKFVRDLTTDVGLTIGNDNSGVVFGTIGVHNYQFYANGARRLNISSTGAATFNEAFTFPTSDGSANQVLKTDGSGNVTWANEAAVSANTSISDADGNTKIQVEESSDENSIRFDTAGTQRMRILSNGLVAIGNGADVPTEKLHVFDNIDNSSVLTTTGTNTRGAIIKIENDNTTAGAWAGFDLRTNTGDARIAAVSTSSDDNDTDLAFIVDDKSAGVGVERLRIKGETGNVGIGSTAPQAVLDLGTATQGRGIAWGGSSGTFHYNTIWSEYSTASIIIGAGLKGATGSATFLNPFTGTYGYAAIELDSFSDDGIKFYTGADASRTKDAAITPTEQMRLDNSGRLGIGTTSPSQKLQVAGTILADTALAASSGNDAIGIGSESTITDTSSTYRIKLVSDSNSAKLTTYSYGSYLTLKAGVDGTNYANNWSKIELRDGGGVGSNNAHMKFYTHGDERMIIDNGGNVGIGTTSPTKSQHLYYTSTSTSVVAEGLAGGSAGKGLLIQNAGTASDSYANLDFRANNADGRIAYQYKGTTNVGDFHFITDNTNSPQTMLFIKNNGPIGLGTTVPGSRLQVGSATADSSNYITFGKRVSSGESNLPFIGHDSQDGTTSDLGLGARSTSGRIRFYTGNAAAFTASKERMILDTNGKLGIGTSSPRNTLDVNTSNGKWRINDYGGMHFQNTTDSLNERYFHSRSTGDLSIGYVAISNLTGGSGGYAAETYDQVRITAGGNVGIGTTNPNLKLVVSSGTTDHIAQFFSTDNKAAISIKDDDTTVFLSAENARGSFGFNIGTNANNLNIDSSGNVGVGTNTLSAKLNVEVLGIDTTTTSTTATTQVAIDTMAAATFRSAEFTIQVTNSTDSTYHLTKVLLIHDGTTPGITEYGTVFTGSAAEATFDADISSGNVRLLATPASTDSMTFKVVRHCITV